MNERQTDLSLNQILDFLNNGGSSYPSCLLLNELGIICLNEQDEDEAGEKYLLSLLDHEKNQKRAIAFCCLARVPEIKEKHSAMLDEFRTRPENEILLPFIDESLARCQD